MTLAFCAGAPFLREGGTLFRPVAGRRARDVLPGFTSGDDPPSSGGVWFLFWTILFFFGTDLFVLIIPIRLLRIGPFASGFSHVSRGVINYKNLPKMKHFVFRWAITTIAVMVASSIIHGIRYDTVAALIGAALLLGILNAFVRPILLILSVPLILLTLGFFILILNALMLFFVPSIVIGFHVDSFWSAFWGAIVVSVVSWILSAFFRGSDGRVHVLTHHTQIRRVQGRVIEPDERR